MKEAIDLVAWSIEILAVLIIVGGILYGMGSYLFHPRQTMHVAYKQFKENIGKSLLLGLEFLIAADVIKTVTFDLTLPGIVLLGGLVLIRTFLSWSLLVEIEGHWPWQAKGELLDRGRGLPVQQTEATD